jgi:hypothetical protein
MTTPAPRRPTLRQVLTEAEKGARDLITHMQAELLPRVAEFRELTRPVRRRSKFPKLIAVQNALRKLQEVAAGQGNMANGLLRQMDEIHERAKQERLGRM